MAMPDPNEVLDFSDAPATDDNGRPLSGAGAGVVRTIKYRDGRIERWLRNPGQDPSQYGTKVGGGLDEKAHDAYIKDRTEAAKEEPKPNSQAAVDEAGRNQRNADRLTEHQRATAAAQQAALTRAQIAATNKAYNQPIQVSGTSYQNPADQGTNEAVDTPASVPTTTTRTVSQAQATYDLNAENARRMEAQNQRAALHDAAQLEWEKTKQALLNDHANRVLSMEAVRAQAEQAYQQIEANLHAQTNAISLRGQDVNAGVTQRGQDLNYVTDLAGKGAAIGMQTNLNFVDPRALAPLNAAMGAVGRRDASPVNIPPIVGTPLPYPDPARLPLVLAREAQQQMPNQYQLPAASAPVNTQMQAPDYSPYQLPKAG